MGACCSNMGVPDASSSTSKSIDVKMSKAARHEKSLYKLLFLGPGSSGKSTIFRQLQWLHCGGIKPEDRLEFKLYIDHQIVRQMRDAIKHYLHDSVADESLQNAINAVKSYDPSDPIPTGVLTSEIAHYISYIWQNDNRLKDVFTRYAPNTIKVLHESTEYFWNSIQRIIADDYIPTRKDIISVRNISTGITEKKFNIKKCNFHIFDIGGQKSERKKWYRCFDEVRAIVFVVGMSSYNETMYEDDKKNAMADALELFDGTIHRETFLKTPIILFLNKKDLFANKIKDVPITVCPVFSDFGKDHDKDALYINNNANDYVQTSYYIESKFKNVNKVENRQIFSHITCAMDDENIKNVFVDVADIVIKGMAARFNNAGMNVI